MKGAEATARLAAKQSDEEVTELRHQVLSLQHRVTQLAADLREAHSAAAKHKHDMQHEQTCTRSSTARAIALQQALSVADKKQLALTQVLILSAKLYAHLDALHH
jgi:hypothetical protein